MSFQEDPTLTNISVLPPCAESTAIGPTTVYHGPALLIWILSPTRMFQNHEVGGLGKPDVGVGNALLNHENVPRKSRPRRSIEYGLKTSCC